MKSFCASAASTLLLLSNVASAGPANPTATIDSGAIIGKTTSFPSSSTVVNQFFGVPFAAPPKRFTGPQEPEPWVQPLETNQKLPACLQQFNYPEAGRNLTMEFFNHPEDPPKESEDCLYLNIYAPAGPAPEKGRTVLFWIYGGGLFLGYASYPDYDGSHFAAYEDVVVVAANYRTNIFGFPNSPDIATEDQNLGFLDQRFALDWVQRNIHAFGGDPNKVTIFGESAGAFSIDALLTSFPKNSTPPFRAAILQSGQLSYRSSPAPGKPYPNSKPSWEALVKGLNCTGNEFECVEKAPATTIKDIIEHQANNFWPVYDNITLVTKMAKRRLDGNIARVPILSGTDADEGRVLEFGVTNLTSYLENLLGPNIDPELSAAIKETYPVGGSQYPTEYDAVAAIETDISFHCAAALVANDTASIGIPSWRYLFNATFPNAQYNGLVSGAFHSSEVGIVFSTYSSVNMTAQEYFLSNYMRGTWARFAKDPEVGPGWNAVGTGGAFLGGAPDLDVGVISETGLTVARQSDVDQKCAIWAGVLKQDLWSWGEEFEDNWRVIESD
ncbi:alpha/beta-hydrolase [Massarina eburnea CBS 473.64]|uniref:Carboxylic ester hydrolase n=1 Tax=Massarina eburnea CBS 473.64 TaxID=1395130 RepID=A0A6A6RVM9_9PLEO|nr:alpha/beta-hydrolase [Massarina eburnea CBS 473.64]